MIYDGKTYKEVNGLCDDCALYEPCYTRGVGVPCRLDLYFMYEELKPKPKNILKAVSVNYTLSVTRKQMKLLVIHKTVDQIPGVSDVKYDGDTMLVHITYNTAAGQHLERALRYALK